MADSTDKNVAVSADAADALTEPEITNRDLFNAISDVATSSRRNANLIESELLPRLTRLETRVFGSKPPALVIGGGHDAVKEPPLMVRQSKSENDTAMLQQQMENIAIEQREMRERYEAGDKVTKAELGQQSRALGLPVVKEGEPLADRRKRASAYLRSSRFLRDFGLVLTIVSTLTASIAAMRAQWNAAPPPAIATPTVPR